MSLETVENILEKVTADYPASRLNKGIKLYREGFVKDFILYKGKIEVVVENSKGYEFVTTIFFDKVQDLKKEILDMSKEQIISLVFDQKNIDSLEKLLDKNNWKFECTCNYKGFCEHSAAALYCFLAESAVFPLTIMNLLGLSRKDILSIITGNEMEEPDIYSDELKKDLDEVNPISYFGEYYDIIPPMKHDSDEKIMIEFELIDNWFYQDLEKIKENVRDGLKIYKI